MLEELEGDEALERELRPADRTRTSDAPILGTDSRSRWLRGLWPDVRYAGRVSWRNPGFTSIAVVTLALGVGANTAMFSIINAVMLRPLPYPEPDRLVRIWESNVRRGWPAWSTSEPNFLDFRARTTMFDAIAASTSQSFTITGRVPLQARDRSRPPCHGGSSSRCLVCCPRDWSGTLRPTRIAPGRERARRDSHWRILAAPVQLGSIHVLVSPDYFATMGIPLRGQEALRQPRCVAESRSTVIISEAMARAYWPDRDPVGLKITPSSFGGRERTIIGVAGDVHSLGLDTEPPRTLFLSTAQLDLERDAARLAKLRGSGVARRRRSATPSARIDPGAPPRTRSRPTSDLLWPTRSDSRRSEPVPAGACSHWSRPVSWPRSASSA